MRLFLIPRFAEILVLPARPAVQALRCRALTAGESICAVGRLRKRSASLQKPPEASFQGCQEFIGLLNVGGAATEEFTAAAAVHVMRIVMVLLLLMATHITCTCSYCRAIVVLVMNLRLRKFRP